MTASLDLDALIAKADSDLRELRRAEIKQLGRRRVAALALAPRWTEQLAKATGLFEKRGQPLREFVKKAEDAGLCASATVGASDAGPERALQVYIAAGAALSDEQAAAALSLVPDDDPHALAELAPALRGASAQDAVDRLLAMKSSERALALIALQPRVDRPDLLEEAAFAALRAPARSRARLLVELSAIDASAADDALAAVAAHPDLALRARLLRRLAPQLADRRDEFMAVVRALPDPEPRIDAALRIPCDPATLAEVAGWVDETPTGQPRDRVRRPLAVAFAKAGNLKDARLVARRIERPDTRALTHGEIAAVADIREADSLWAGVNLALLESVTPARALGVRATVIRGLLKADRAPVAAAFASDVEARLTWPTQLTADWLLPLTQFASVLPPESTFAKRAAQAAHALALDLGGARERCEALLCVAELATAEAPRALEEAVSAFYSVSDPLERATLLPALLPALEPPRAREIVDQTTALARDTAEEFRFWAPDALRVEILTLLSEAPGRDTKDLTEQARAAGVAVLAARDRGVPVEKHVLRWAELAAENGTAASFLGRYRRAVRVADTATALDWIDTGTFFCGAVPEAALAAGVRYARRQTELLYREARERRAPEPFLEREEQLAAFRDLLADKKSGWALHYVGAGGVGKSSLIRHLQRTAADDGFATAKVDFDYLGPDYPFKRPGELLYQLMAELELYAGPDEERLVASFGKAITRLHEQTAEGTKTAPLEQIKASRFVTALRAFCAYLTALDRDVVLFLDTCEELARFQPRNARAPTIEAAFGVLEAIRAELERLEFDRVHVVLAGRRLLAAGGHGGWTASHGFGAAQKRRKYLRIHRIDGFLDGEARRFLQVVRKLDVNQTLITAILEASPPPELTEPLVLPDESAEPAAKPPDRYNPFDLGMYADWITEEGPMDPAALESGASDPYIDLRVVRRIQADRVPGLRELLPSVALLWRFDEQLLEPAYDGPQDRFVNAYSELADQDWIRAVDGQLVVEANLRPRLLKYFDDAQPAAKKALAKGVEDRLRTAPLGEQTPEHVLAAARILDPAVFTEIWHARVAEAAAQERWDWLDPVSWRLLSDDSGLRFDHPAKSAVMAAHNAVELHLNGAADARYWEGILEAPAPDPTAQAWLEARARAGLALRDPAPLAALIEASPAGTGDQDVQLAASLCAALERMDRFEGITTGSDLSAWADRLSPLEPGAELLAAAHTLAARAYVEEHAWDEARHEIARATTPLRQTLSGRQRWLDWLAPEFPRHRVRLETLRLGLAVHPDEVVAWGEAAVEDIASIDGERLLSAVLQQRLEHGLVPAEELDRLARHNQYDRERSATCLAHEAVQPLFVTIALGWAALGDHPAAMATLLEHINAAKDSTLDPATVFAGERAALLVHRRMRSDDPVLVGRYAGSADPDDRAAALAVIALTRSVREQPEGDLDTVPWSFRVGLWPERERRLLALGETLPPYSLDWMEWMRLRGQEVRARQPIPLERQLRAKAITSAPLKLDGEGAPPGDRRVAQAALEVGELLALRLPDQALALLKLAHHRFDAAEDPFGAVVAATCRVLASKHAGRASERERLGRTLHETVKAAGGEAALPPAWRERVEHARLWCEDELERKPPPARPQPVELALVPRHIEPEPARRSWWRAALTFLVSTLVFGALLAGAFAVLRFVLSAVGLPVEDGVLLIALGALFIAGAVIFALLNSLLSSRRDQAVAVSLARLSTRERSTALGPPWPPSQPAALRLRLELPRLFSRVDNGSGLVDTLLDFGSLALRGRYRTSSPLRPGEPTDVEAADWTTPDPGPYWHAAEAFPATMTEPITAVTATARRARLPLAIEPGRSLAGLPWEALMLLATGSAQPRLQPFRAGSANRDMYLDRRWNSRAACVTGGEWNALAAVTTRHWRYVTSTNVLSANLLGAGTGLIHVTGRPISGTSGELLQIGAAGEVISGKGQPSGTTTTLTPEELWLPGAATVLQAEPLDLGSRFDTDREEAARLKLLAFDVFTAGAEAVLVIPALPALLAYNVAERVGRVLRPRRRFNLRPSDRRIETLQREAGIRVSADLRRLLDLVDELRTLIREWEVGPEDVRMELALDVCLYAGGVMPLTTSPGSDSR